MPITLTIGTNTFVSLADAEIYFAERIYSDAWTGTNDLKSQALIEATKRIDRQVYRGRKVSISQKLAFPRAIYCPERYSVQMDNIYYSQDWYVEEEISQEVKDACCEEALAILSQGSTNSKRNKLQQQGVSEFTVGNITEKYNTGNFSNKLLSSESVRLLSKYLGGISIC